MRAPKNIVKENLYTSGGEFIKSDTKDLYQGYYHEINGNYFVGKKSTPNAVSLSKGSTQTSKPQSRFFRFNPKDIEKGYSKRYFIKKVNSNPILIKEVDENTFKNTKNDTSYQAVELKYFLAQKGEGQDFKGGVFNPIELNEADKKMPGLKIFLNT